ncbi:MAG: S-4TM family putative pore-forming effector [Gordonibacter sp.]
MNNGNTILIEQEREENLLLLAAQRAAYSSAKVIDFWAAVVFLGIPLAVTVYQSFCALPFSVIVVLDVAVLLIGTVVMLISEGRVRLGARIQQRFDSVVFGMRFENTESDETQVKKYEARYRKRHSDLSDFNLWYSVSLEGLTAGKAIARCQTQNAYWTSGLMRAYLICLFVLAIIVGALIALLVFFTCQNPASYAFLLSILEWTIAQGAKGIRVSMKARNLSKDIGHYNLIHKASIERTQNDIFEYRSASFLVPDWFYNLRKKMDEARTTA